MIISRPDQSSLVDEDFAPERVIVDLGTGRYYCLNESAALVWMAVESEAKSSVRICRELSHHFILDAAVAQVEIETFVVTMEEAKLLVVDRTRAEGGLSAETGEMAKPQTPWIAPSYVAYNDLENLLLIDPIHEVDDQAGWPQTKPENPPR